MNATLKFSVIIANFNYGRFVGRAIDSALNLDWPDVEVVVVDDGSTDDSRTVIETYGSKIKVIFQANAGQRAANNIGFAASTGDLVVFLDSDDMLDSALAREVAHAWQPGVSKVQVQMQKIDEHDCPFGSTLPKLGEHLTAAQIRDWAMTNLEYPSPPGSGNIFPRTFLQEFFPLDDTRDAATDSTCIAMAPILGDVLTIAKPLVLYRIHGANDSNMLSNDGTFGREIKRALKRFEAACDACAMREVVPPPTSALRRGNHLLQLRAASLRLRPSEHPLDGDSRFAAFSDALRLPFRSSFEPVSRRLIIAAYSMIVLGAPLGLAKSLIHRRFKAH